MSTFVNIGMAVIIGGFYVLVLYVFCKCLISVWRDFTGNKE